jgi:hypothetical protein
MNLDDCSMSGLIFKMIGIAVTAVAVAVLLGLLMMFPIKWCWNYTMPYIFGLPVITWGQAWCLSFLCGALIKSNKITKE